VIGSKVVVGVPTIYKHLDAWQVSKKDVPVQAVFEMPEPVKAAFNGTWQIAANEAFEWHKS
jgi:hypothetical protein